MNSMTRMRRVLRSLVCIALLFALTAASSDPVLAASKKKSKAVKNIVIALDPGHDTTHHGCTYGSFEEGFANLAIAMYCKQELETYKGVTVYLTRSTLDCPYGADPSTSAGCLTGRVNFAKSVGAAALISLHNDYDGELDKSQNGSKIIIPNPYYRPDICMTGFGLAQSILPQLNAIGLNTNNWKLCPNGTGIVTRNSGVGTYPDGTPKDYYALINKSKTAGLPCIIVEHAYCTNDSDLQNHLSTQAQLQELGIADAKGIAAYYGLSK